MRTEIETQTDETGSIHVRVPGVGARRGVHVVVEWEEPAKDANGWPIGWIEATAGSITDPTFVVPPDEPWEKRRDFE